MARVEDVLVPELTSKEQAIEVGYKDGASLRENGALPGHLDDQREMLEKGHPMRRGPGVQFYEDWRRGFDAGYRGDPKPSA